MENKLAVCSKMVNMHSLQASNSTSCHSPLERGSFYKCTKSTDETIHSELLEMETNWKQPKHPSIGQQIHELSCCCSMKYQAVVKKNVGDGNSVATSTLVCRSWSLIPFPTKRNQSSLEKWLILGLRQGRYKMSLEHCVMPESKNILEK